MTRPHTHAARSVLLSLALCACGSEQAEQGVVASARSGAQPSLVVMLDERPEHAEVGCALAGARLPGWRGVALFEQGSPGVAAIDREAPGELRRFCRFEWAGQEPGASVGPLATRATKSKQVRFGPARAEAMRARHRAQVGWVPGPALGSSSSARAAIEVAIVDTVSARAAADPEITPSDSHGVVIGALVGDHLCPDRAPACLANVHHVLALPLEDAGGAPNWVEGGWRGTSADIALAIYEAVEGWRARGTTAHLVLNLSLGLDPISETSAGDRALRAALEYASCQGVLVFASSGNCTTEGCQGSRGPLAPASFEVEPAPDGASCRALGFGDRVESPRPPRPLVHAVGAVEGSGLALTTARAESQPRLAAAATHALGLDSAGAYTPALTGSSIAAAVASGVAALVWSYRPDLPAERVVEILYASGRETGERAAFGLAGAPDEVRMISACAALRAACLEAPTCPILDCDALAEDQHARARALAERPRDHVTTRFDLDGG